MKHSTSLLILISAVAMLSIQTAHAQAQTTWAQSYGFASYNRDGTRSIDQYYGSGYDYAQGIARMPDGGFVVSARLDLPELQSADAGSNACTGLIRYSNDGTIIWQKLLRQGNDQSSNGILSPGVSHIRRMLTDTVGNIYICGGKGNPGTGEYDGRPFVAKFDKDGNLIWQNGIQGAAYRVADSSAAGFHDVVTGVGEFLGMGLTADGGVIAAASEYEPGNGHSVPSVVKFNRDGGYATIDATGSAPRSNAFHSAFEVLVQYDGAQSVCQSFDGKRYAVLVQFPISTSYPGPRGTTILILDLEGNLLFQQEFDPNDGKIEAPKDIFATSDGGFIAWSRLGASQTGNVLIRKLSNVIVTDGKFSLNVEWERFVGSTGDAGFEGDNLTTTNDGGYLLGGQTGGHVAIVKLSSAGDLLFASIVGGTGGEGNADNRGANGGAYAIGAADGGYAFATQSLSYKSDPTKPDVWVGKTDANRRITNFPDLMGDALDFVSNAATDPGAPGTAFALIPRDAVYAIPNSLPNFILENLANGTGNNTPNIMVQAPPTLRALLPVVGNLQVTPPASVQNIFQNGLKWLFNVNFNSTADGLVVKVQATTTPLLESSWTDLRGGGVMTNDAAGHWTLSAFAIPEGAQIYFRVLAAAPSFHNAVSKFTAPFKVAANAPPSVNDFTVTPAQPTTTQAVTLTASVSDTGGIADVAFYVDGALVGRVTAAPYQLVIPHLAAGSHLAALIVTDNVGGISYGSRRVLVVPASGKYYTSNNAGAWNDPKNWNPSGVPGPQDLADVANYVMTLPAGTTEVGAVVLSSGGISGPGTLLVDGNFTLIAGTLKNLTVEVPQGGSLPILGSPQLNGVTVNNHGLVNCSQRFTGDATTTINNYGVFTFALQIGTSFGLGGSSSAGTFTNHASLALNGGVLVLTGSYDQPAGEVDLGSAPTPLPPSGAVVYTAGVLQAPTVNITGGSVTGSGKIKGNLNNSGGYLSPGHSAGLVQIEGNYTQGASGTMILEIGGAKASTPDFDQLNITGSATLGGKLDVRAIGGFAPASSAAFSALTYTSFTGSFSVVSSNAQITLGITAATVSVDTSKPAPSAGKSLNIATRLQILGGENVLIEGFIITGPAGSTKKVLIRGLGLSTGLAGAIADPILELNGTGVHVVNDDWQQGDTAQIPPGFSPSNSKESVIVATVAPGNYTAILRNVSGQVGIGLTEVYDLDSAGVPQLANIATRGLVQTGDNVMIGGFIIGGTEPAKVLVRVTGPTLTQFGIAGALADPTLELHDSNGGVISDDDWRATQESEIIATTIPPANDKEPAILATLVPGNYTAVVRGANNTTGVAVVEAYNLQ